MRILNLEISVLHTKTWAIYTAGMEKSVDPGGFARNARKQHGYVDYVAGLSIETSYYYDSRIER